MNGKLKICVGRVVKAKKGIMFKYNGLMRVAKDVGNYVCCYDEGGSMIKIKRLGKRTPKMFHKDDLIVAK